MSVIVFLISSRSMCEVVCLGNIGFIHNHRKQQGIP